MGGGVVVREARDAAVGDAIGEAGCGMDGVPAAAIALSGFPKLGDGERGEARDIAGGVDALAIDGDALCAPLAPPIHV
jgi:hypothetical protein